MTSTGPAAVSLHRGNTHCTALHKKQHARLRHERGVSEEGDEQQPSAMEPGAGALHAPDAAAAHPTPHHNYTAAVLADALAHPESSQQTVERGPARESPCGRRLARIVRYARDPAAVRLIVLSLDDARGSGRVLWESAEVVVHRFCVGAAGAAEPVDPIDAVDEVVIDDDNLEEAVAGVLPPANGGRANDVGCVWSKDGRFVYVAASNPGVLIKVEIVGSSKGAKYRPLIVKRRVAVPAIDDIDNMIRVRNVTVSDGGEYVLLSTTESHLLHVFRASDLGEEAILRHPHDCTFRGKGYGRVLYCYEWDNYERREAEERARVAAASSREPGRWGTAAVDASARDSSHIGTADEPVLSQVRKRPRLGMAGVQHSRFSKKICEFGDSMALYINPCVSWNQRYIELIWYDIRAGTFCVVHLRHEDLPQHIYTSTRYRYRPVSDATAFDGRWVVVRWFWGNTMVHFFIDTNRLARFPHVQAENASSARPMSAREATPGLQVKTGRRRLQKRLDSYFRSSVQTALFEGVSTGFAAIRAGRTAKECSTALCPRIVMSNVVFYGRNAPTRPNSSGVEDHHDWVMHLDTTTGYLVPDVSLSFLRIPTRSSLISKMRYLETIGMYNISYCAPFLFPEKMQLLPRNQAILASWLADMDAMWKRRARRRIEQLEASESRLSNRKRCASKSRGSGHSRRDTRRNGARVHHDSWLSVLADKAVDTLDLIAGNLNLHTRGLLAIAYPHLATAVLADSGMRHALLASWAIRGDALVPLVRNQCQAGGPGQRTDEKRVVETKQDSRNRSDLAGGVARASCAPVPGQAQSDSGFVRVPGDQDASDTAVIDDWNGMQLEDLALALLRTLTIAGDLEALRVVADGFTYGHCGGSPSTFLAQEDCTAAEAFCARLAHLEEWRVLESRILECRRGLPCAMHRNSAQTLSVSNSLADSADQPLPIGTLDTQERSGLRKGREAATEHHQPASRLMWYVAGAARVALRVGMMLIPGVSSADE